MNQKKLTSEDKKLIRQIQGDLPLNLTPFTTLAQHLGWPEKELRQRIRGLIKRGIIRRFGAILRHQKAGYMGNAMVIWQVPEKQILQVSRVVASLPAVSHCYLRPSFPHWPFNLYVMLHGPTGKDCHLLAREISKSTGLKKYQILFSKREHKKSSMRYFE